MEIRIYYTQYEPASNLSEPLELSSGSMLSAGEHNLVKLIALPTCFDEVLLTELSRSGRGRLLVACE